ncbi:MAG: hypothetical protein II388_01400, partial [Clostridia bacterium]|nr:hypothetical protein [Clostridia bacterium]
VDITDTAQTAAITPATTFVLIVPAFFILIISFYSCFCFSLEYIYMIAEKSASAYMQITLDL